MRLLLLAHAPSIHTQRWARAFASRGHEVRLLSVHPAIGASVSPSAPAADAPGRVRVPAEPIGDPTAPLPFLRYLRARRDVRAVLRSWKPDVTVAHFLPNYGFLAAIAGARPFVLAAWGSDLLVNARRTPLHAVRARWVLRRAAWVHVDAENLAEAARALGAPADRVWTRAWGVDAAALAPGRPWAERVRGSGGPAAGGPALRVLWTRMLEPIYDPASFLEALALLRDRGVAFTATMAGDGPLRASLEAAARASGIAGSLRFTGLVDEEQLRGLYRTHEIYVSMSRSDSTSQSLLEAMAAGLYCVASDIPGNRPWIGPRERPGGARAARGALVAPGDAAALADALAGVAADPGAAARVEGAAALVRAEGDWSDTVAACEARLRALAGGGGRAR